MEVTMKKIAIMSLILALTGTQIGLAMDRQVMPGTQNNNNNNNVPANLGQNAALMFLTAQLELAMEHQNNHQNNNNIPAIPDELDNDPMAIDVATILRGISNNSSPILAPNAMPVATNNNAQPQQYRSATELIDRQDLRYFGNSHEQQSLALPKYPCQTCTNEFNNEADLSEHEYTGAWLCKFCGHNPNAQRFNCIDLLAHEEACGFALSIQCGAEYAAFLENKKNTNNNAHNSMNNIGKEYASFLKRKKYTYCRSNHKNNQK